MSRKGRRTGRKKRADRRLGKSRGVGEERDEKNKENKRAGKIVWSGRRKKKEENRGASGEKAGTGKRQGRSEEKQWEIRGRTGKRAEGTGEDDGQNNGQNGSIKAKETGRGAIAAVKWKNKKSDKRKNAAERAASVDKNAGNMV